ncbi:hypothetical protein EDD18DRAFT_1365628 [Armillaria luteobubalina]|uniref:Uncharacterized protein n=1 Tax=Armillaria luteobubalina TaxID=153913 RepID=A0AA39P3Z6_9AGAR|nr:hypothetical protein EDD18DRAFT_1365628 [Armillaria luteobubalina]
MNLPDILSPGMTLGAVCVGAVVAAILFGITTLQAGFYYKNYSDDLWVYRYSVASLWILDALHIALSTHALYYYLIKNFTAINHVVWCFKLQILFDVLIIMAVQSVYFPFMETFALILLNPHMLKSDVYSLIVDQSYYTVVLCFVILAVIAVFTGSGIYVIVHIYSLSNFLSVENIKKFISIAVSAAAGSESAIAVSMCYYLHKSRSVPNFTRSANSVLKDPPPVVVLSLAASQPLIHASMRIYTPIYAGFRLTTILRSLAPSVLHLRFTFKSVGKRTEGKALGSAVVVHAVM